MTNDLTILFRDELSAGERLLWTGQPKQGLLLRLSDAFVIPFSLLWGGLLLLFPALMVIDGGPPITLVISIPIALMGLYAIAGRFVVDAWRRRKTVYALTNERAMIVAGLFRRTVRFLSLKALADITLTLGKNGRGTILFGPSHPLAEWNAAFAWQGMSGHAPAEFERITDARQVYEMLRTAQRAP